MIAVRVAMGLFEGVVFPATAALCAAWIPPATIVLATLPHPHPIPPCQ